MHVCLSPARGAEPCSGLLPRVSSFGWQSLAQCLVVCDLGASIRDRHAVITFRKSVEKAAKQRIQRPFLFDLYTRIFRKWPLFFCRSDRPRGSGRGCGATGPAQRAKRLCGIWNTRFVTRNLRGGFPLMLAISISRLDTLDPCRQRP